MKYTINSTTEQLKSTGGLALVGPIIKKIGFDFTDSEAKREMKKPEVLRVLTGLFVQGRSSFEEISLFRHDSFFADTLKLSYVPAPETLRLYTEQVAGNYSYAQERIQQSNTQLLNLNKLSPVTAPLGSYIPVDCDVSPLNNAKSNKEGVSRTYKGFDGYAPTFSYIGAEGYMLDCALRIGKQHCQKDTPRFLFRNLAIIEDLELDHPILFRLDGGYDAASTLKVLANSGHFFLVRHNLRKQFPQTWLEIAKAEGKVTYKSSHKTVYTGFHTGRTPAGDDSIPAMDLVFKVTERYKDAKGNPLLINDIEVEAFWTNLYEDPCSVIRLYHDHGTSEQFHSELKSDMGIERLPSGKFLVNALLLQVSMISFNILRMIGQCALAFPALLPYPAIGKRKRLRKVIDDLIRVACKVVSHARVRYLKLWDKDPWLPVFSQLQALLTA